MRGGEAYELPPGSGSGRLLGGELPRRAEVYRAGAHGAQVRYVGSDGADRWSFISLRDGAAPAGWRMSGLARPSGRMTDGREVWYIPGPPWGASLTWAGPGAPLIRHDAGPRPGWLGPDAGAVSDSCAGITEAQAAADAWWLAELGRHVTRGKPDGQQSLFQEAS